ncbi:hypothetical protein ACHAWT_000019, partial [Skeletonema menzelii]
DPSSNPTVSIDPSFEPSGVPSVSSEPSMDPKQSQLYALKAFYFATNGDSWDINSGWLDSSQSECDWFGVTCDDENIVTSLDLGNNNLSGSIPTEIGLLKSLEYLYLYTHQLTGTIPSEIGLMENLTVLDLYNNQLNGTIPSEIGLMENLEKLDLAVNDLTGTIPSEIGLMKNLSELFAFFNRHDIASHFSFCSMNC